MEITVLGASGRIGGLAVREALARGWHVTAVVCDPARLTVPAHPRLDVAVHSLTDPGLADAVTDVTLSSWHSAPQISSRRRSTPTALAPWLPRCAAPGRGSWW